jgi:hypothetical protein
MQQWDGKDLNGYVDLLRKNGASGQTVLGMQQHIIAMHAQASEAIKNDADAAKMQFDTENEKNQHLAAIVGNVLKLDPSDQPQALEEGKQTAIKNGWLDPQHAANITYHSPEQLQGVQKMLMGQSNFTADYQKQAQAEKDKQDAALAQMKVKQQSGLQSGAMDSQIDTIFPPTGKTTSGPNQRYKTQANFYLQRGDLQGAQGVLSAASAEAGKTEEMLNPDIQANKLALSTAEGAARANVETAAARGSNAALANVPKELITPATEAYSKEGQNYATAVQAAKNMSDFIQMAKSGNKEAVKIVPLQGALEITTAQGVHRINRTEVDQFGGAGSLYDKLAGKVGGVLTGKDITDDVLNDMDALQKTVSANAKDLHSNRVDAINTSFGSSFKPMNFKAGTTPSTTPQHVPGGKATGLTEGQTGTGSDKKKYIVKGGVWVPQ